MAASTMSYRYLLPSRSAGVTGPVVSVATASSASPSLFLTSVNDFRFALPMTHGVQL